MASLAGIPIAGGPQQPERFVVRGFDGHSEGDWATCVCVTLGQASERAD